MQNPIIKKAEHLKRLGWEGWNLGENYLRELQIKN
jgi:hypothetical protein